MNDASRNKLRQHKERIPAAQSDWDAKTICARERPLRHDHVLMLTFHKV